MLAMETSHRITIGATFNVGMLVPLVQTWIAKLVLNCNISVLPYGQLFQELLDHNKRVELVGGESIFIAIRFYDLVDKGGIDLVQRVMEAAKLFIDTILVASNRGSLITIMLCPSTEVTKVDKSDDIASTIELAGQLVNSELRGRKNIEFISVEKLFEDLAVADPYDPLAECMGHMPYTEEGFSALAVGIARKVFEQCGTPSKVIVVDADNTLWRGECGGGEEDICEGICYDPTAAILQEFLLEKINNGFLLCLCSKNIAVDVKTAFEKHPEMALSLSNFVLTSISWERKYLAVAEFALELGLDKSSFIFLDDDVIECEEMRVHCPEVVVIKIPQTEVQMRRTLNHIWSLDRGKLTDGVIVISGVQDK